MQQIQPFLMFKKQAEEAIALYVKTFPNSKILNTVYWTEKEVQWMKDNLKPEDVAGPAGSVKTVEFEIKGQRFDACNGGNAFDFSMGISLCVNCETQEEIDKFSQALSAEGGEQLNCGWVKDKFGVYWQIIPASLQKMLNSPDRKKAERVNLALNEMKKIDMKKLDRAFEETSISEESAQL
jgi:predicted 3-demethylubiquinone-9 3-methyltransferase (glyoxalase superfamily)